DGYSDLHDACGAAEGAGADRDGRDLDPAPRGGGGAHPAGGVRGLCVQPHAVGGGGVDAVPAGARGDGARGVGLGGCARRGCFGGAGGGPRGGAVVQVVRGVRRGRGRRHRPAPGRAGRAAVPRRAAGVRDEHLPPQRHQRGADGGHRGHRLPGRAPHAPGRRRGRPRHRHLPPPLLAGRGKGDGRARADPDGRPLADHRAGEGAYGRRLRGPRDRGRGQAVAAGPRRGDHQGARPPNRGRLPPGRPAPGEHAAVELARPGRDQRPRARPPGLPGRHPRRRGRRRLRPPGPIAALHAPVFPGRAGPRPRRHPRPPRRLPEGPGQDV
ncbi:MAG: Threonine dehydrogenase and related Zn-dependent dehydrogenases, partial [uncultured Sphingomonadaceae bacterium]